MEVYDILDTLYSYGYKVFDSPKFCSSAFNKEDVEFNPALLIFESRHNKCTLSELFLVIVSHKKRFERSELKYPDAAYSRTLSINSIKIAIDYKNKTFFSEFSIPIDSLLVKEDLIRLLDKVMLFINSLEEVYKLREETLDKLSNVVVRDCFVFKKSAYSSTFNGTYINIMYIHNTDLYIDINSIGSQPSLVLRSKSFNSDITGWSKEEIIEYINKLY